ncbi:ester hydrolase C11orf54 homolog [Ctenocephalides felis]|uniref:ester hydrolase C11orf54 homolog n=1 Tax=Ctenocephalides felis TaxID=7515 RepID=UPI000E6E4F40|nr:ester hydrolase C11orf54 homolog [Ctenocephalides felis]
METLKFSDLKYEEKDLHIPSLQEVKEVLSGKLPNNFTHVSVDIVECPDLTQKPFCLAAPGLSGNPNLLELGGAPYLLPLVQREKIYDIKNIAKSLDLSPVLAIGAGAGPWPYAGVCCEGIFNMHLASDGTLNNKTHIATVNMENGACVLGTVPNDETRCALLGNLFLSEGHAGSVLRVHCATRHGPKDFIASIRTALSEHYGDQVVGLGGTFLLKQGRARQHVMTDFSETPIYTEEQLNAWLRFFQMEAPLVAVGTLVTAVTDLDLRVQHFHSFSDHGLGGHYHIDTTPDSVEYLGYFNVAKKIMRLDRPEKTHMFGRD